MDALREAYSMIDLASGREGPETRDQSALLAVAFALLAIVERLDFLIAKEEAEAERQELRAARRVG